MFTYLEHIAFYITVLPAVVAITKWRSLNSSHRWLASLLLAIVIISFSGDLYRTWGETDRNNMPFFHVYILVEFLLLLQAFRLLFQASISKIAWGILNAGFVVIWLINVFSYEGWWGFPNYIHALEAIIILGLVVKWFLKMLREKTVAQPIKTFEFWMCAGLLIYFTGNFLLFLFPKFIIDAGAEVFRAIWKMNCILIILLYLSYTIALLWVKKKVK